MCKSSGVHIVNGRYYMDQGKGMYTCHTPNGGHSVVGYVIGSTHMIDSIFCNFEIGDMTTLSTDHCPLLFSIPRTIILDNQ